MYFHLTWLAVSSSNTCFSCVQVLARELFNVLWILVMCTVIYALTFLSFTICFMVFWYRRLWMMTLTPLRSPYPSWNHSIPAMMSSLWQWLQAERNWRSSTHRPPPVMESLTRGLDWRWWPMHTSMYIVYMHTWLYAQLLSYIHVYVRTCTTHLFKCTHSHVPSFLNSQTLHAEVEKQRSEFDQLLQSCDLYDTPFEQTQFESDVTAMREQLAACDKVQCNLRALLFLQCLHSLFAIVPLMPIPFCNASVIARQGKYV